MKQTMQKELGTVKVFWLLVMLLALVAGPILLSAPTGEEKTAQCASFALPISGAEQTKAPLNYDLLRLSVGGMPFGVRFFTKGVLVVGIADVVTEDGAVCPAKDAGINRKDILKKIDGIDINTAEEVTRLIEKCDGKELTLTLEREGKELLLKLTPVPSKPDGAYRAGLWIKDSTAGIGTVTMYDSQSGQFWGLGHGICDVETGELMPLLRATVSGVTISGITKGKCGCPGELKGYFGNAVTGELWQNSEAGVSGKFEKLSIDSPENTMPLARKKEVKADKAYIYCTLDDNRIEKYEIRIEKIRSSDAGSKNFTIRVTDPDLIAKTGGIVQGMSGSPIIQNGKIVGAVTHVLVADPTAGYGIFAENMIQGTQ